MDAGEAEAKKKRRRKIKELEATLFGADNEWTNTTDLPKVKNVHEYANRFGEATMRSQLPLPRLKTAPRRHKKGPSLMLGRRKKRDEFDAIPLIRDDEDQEDTTEQYEAAAEKEKSTRLMSRTQRILKSEVEQLDEAFSRIFNEEPQKRVINNLKKKHGIRSSTTQKYDRLDQSSTNTPVTDDRINVQAFREKMSRAQLCDTIMAPDIKVDPSPDQKRSSRCRTGVPSTSDKSESIALLFYLSRCSACLTFN